MKSKASKIWVVALLLALVCIVFPPRRDTEQGRDRESTPSRRFLWADTLVAVAPDGSRSVLAGFGASTPEGQALRGPGEPTVAPDGTLYCLDRATGFIHARGADKTWRQVAGTFARVQDLAKGTVTVNGPTGAVFDEQNRLVFSELSSETIKRFDGQRIEVVVGGAQGPIGDGGPATMARLAGPKGLTLGPTGLHLLDTLNDRLRRVRPDGVIETLVGMSPVTGFEPTEVPVDGTVPANGFLMSKAAGVALLADGTPIWTTRRQVLRLGTDGLVHVVAGTPSAQGGGLDLGALLGASGAPKPGREADIAVRMVRPAQGSLVARKLADLPIVTAAHQAYLQRAGTPRKPQDLLQHRLIGYDRDDTIERGFARLGVALPREAFALRTDDQVAYGRLIASGAGIGFVAQYNLAHWPGVVPLLPMLRIPPLPCWLAVHREIRGNALVRRVYDHLAEALPPVARA